MTGSIIEFRNHVGGLVATVGDCELKSGRYTVGLVGWSFQVPGKNYVCTTTISIHLRHGIISSLHSLFATALGDWRYMIYISHL